MTIWGPPPPWWKFDRFEICLLAFIIVSAVLAIILSV